MDNEIEYKIKCLKDRIIVLENNNSNLSDQIDTLSKQLDNMKVELISAGALTKPKHNFLVGDRVANKNFPNEHGTIVKFVADESYIYIKWDGCSLTEYSFIDHLILAEKSEVKCTCVIPDDNKPQRYHVLSCNRSKRK